ncbi:SH3 domain-containing protein [Leptolyngbya sp. CCNP1308]|uniref:SH3 domain-containing protein n=1 Tax=Leptolyngbya sp. CCNP1308 TaxID=3110255 RepID=UPI002B1F051B|nr:SH3 domain-containing protein [Leptolyngbya sp. CCNP1308]MEA5448192.1 SH3 domain-containing protein [Leptolyngbya sp. CCNP1308]
MKGFFLGLSKLILGVAIALILLSMAGVATARYFMGRLSVLPPKPLYGDEMPAPEPEAAPETAAEPAVEPPPEPAPVAEAPLDPALEPGAYNATVVQPIGLVMREGPGVEFPQVGGVDVNEAVVVLEEPADQSWVKVRVVSNGQEGWVKAGNTRRTE